METYIKKPEIVKHLQEQYDHEVNNYRIYLNMAVYCSKLGLRGHVKYFEHRAKEEHDHARRVKDIIQDANLELLPGALPEVTRNFSSLVAMHAEVLKLEEQTTALLNRLGREALDAGLFQLFTGLNWLLNEQIEEEKVSRDALEISKSETDDLTIDQAIGELFS